MNCRGFYIGPIAAALFVAAVVVGGFLREGYSHTFNTVSELLVAGSTTLVPVIILFGLYNLGLILLALGPSRMAQSKQVKITLWLVGFIGLLGGLLLIFPQDPRNSEMTTIGMTHIILAGAVSLLTITAAVLSGFAFQKVEHKNMARISWWLAAFILLTGGCAAVGISQEWQTVGLWERFTIGAFLGWLVWFTLKVKWIMYHEII